MIKSDTGYIRSINAVFVAIFSVVLVLALWHIRTIILLAVAAIFLTVFVSMPVRFFVSRGVSRGLSIVFSVLAGFILTITVILLVFPILFQQFTVLFTDIVPRGVNQFTEWWNSGIIFEQLPFLQSTIDEFVLSAELVNQAINQITTALGQLGVSVVPLVSDLATSLLSILIIIFMGLYFLAEPDRYINGVISLTPMWYRTRMREILISLDNTTRAWLRVTGASMIFVGVFTSLGLALVGIQQWAALGVLAGLLSFIPNFGPLVALIPSLAVAIIQAPDNVLLVVVIIYGVSFLQSQVIGPILASENMNLAPVAILVGQIVFGIFFGFMGLLLAVPLTAVLTVIVREVYIKDILVDPGQTSARQHSDPSALRYEELVAETD